MSSNTKLFARPILAFAVVSLCAAAGTVPAAAQSERCTDLYGDVMALYQTNPYSPDYAQAANYYSSRCLAGGPSNRSTYSTPYRSPYPWR